MGMAAVLQDGGPIPGAPSLRCRRCLFFPMTESITQLLPKAQLSLFLIPLSLNLGVLNEAGPA